MESQSKFKNPQNLSDELAPLPDTEDIIRARNIGEKWLGKFPPDMIKKMREMAKWDLLWLADSILGYDKVSPHLHGHLCLWLEKYRWFQFRMILLPRSHFKSTIVTITDSIQTALPDDTGNAIYPYNLGTNVRICIAHDVADMAQKFLRSITLHFLSNPYLIALFPECIPDKSKQKVNIKETCLPRTAVWNESTFDTMGVGTAGQGNHFNKLKLDDIYGEKPRDSPTERLAYVQWFDNVQSFLITPATDQIDISGTRWAHDDVYAHAMKTYGPSEDDPEDKLLKYIRSVWEPDKNGQMQPIFPEQFTIKSLNILKKNRKVWNAQYINDPREGSASFQPEWKRFYTWRPRTRDIEVTERSNPLNDGYTETIPFQELDRLIFLDPAMGEDKARKRKDFDPSAIVVTGTDYKARHYTLETWKEDVKPEQLRDKVFSLVAKWNPRGVVIEKVLFSALYAPWWNTEMRIRGLKFQIILIETNQKAKNIRVAGLSNYFSNNEIYFHESQTELIREYDEFGATDDYHTLDALAMGPKVWRKAGRRIIAPTKTQVQEVLRDINTGYSRIR